MGELRARLWEEPQLDVINVIMVEKSASAQGGRILWGPGERGVQPEQVDGAPLQKPLQLPYEEAFALYVALAAHFGGGDTTQALRKDYNEERKRVDRLMDHVMRSASDALGLASSAI